jgi:hypothetical protein
MQKSSGTYRAENNLIVAHATIFGETNILERENSNFWMTIFLAQN